MAQSSTKRSAAQGERASGGVQGQPTHLVWQLALGFGQGRSRAHEPQQRGITKRDDRASAIAILYQTCKTWRKQLSDDGFCMRTFSLCRALADGNSPQTLQRVQATIGRQLGRLPDQDERAWWLDARSLVQRCNSPGGPGNVWSWLQAASQEPDGPLSQQAAATAEMLGWRSRALARQATGQVPGAVHTDGALGCRELRSVFAGWYARRQRVRRFMGRAIIL